jgi:hypothetical protein
MQDDRWYALEKQRRIFTPCVTTTENRQVTAVFDTLKVMPTACKKITRPSPRRGCYIPTNISVTKIATNSCYKRGNVRIMLRATRVRLTTVAMDKHTVYVCILSHPACKAHSLYYIIICGLSGSNLINGTIFERKFTEHKMCFDFLHNVCLKQFSF